MQKDQYQQELMLSGGSEEEESAGAQAVDDPVSLRNRRSSHAKDKDAPEGALDDVLEVHHALSG